MSEAVATYDLTVLDLEVLVREQLEKAFGWISLDSLMYSLPKEQQDADEIEKLLWQLADRAIVRLRVRPGSSLLVSLVRAEQPLPEIAPPPPPKPTVVKYIEALDNPSAPQLPRAPKRAVQPIPLRRAVSPAKAQPLPETPPMPLLSKADQILEILAKGPKTTNEVAKALDCNDAAAGFHLYGLVKTKKICKPQGRMGPWALISMKSAIPAPRNPGPPIVTAKSNGHRHDVAELRWSIRNDGLVTFAAGDHQLEIDGKTLERVMAARQAIADAA